MAPRLVALIGAAAFLSACPSQPPPTTEAPDAGPSTRALVDCAGLCADNEICDVDRQVCVSGCKGATCGLDEVCTRVDAGSFRCMPVIATCNRVACERGQSACIAGRCSCVPGTATMADSCALQGKRCNGLYNVTTDAGGECVAPGRYQSCRTKRCAPGACSPCASGLHCLADEAFLGEENAMCFQTCQTTNDCHADEICEGTFGVCLPRGFYNSGICTQPIAGGAVLEVSPPSACLFGNEPTPTGNCSQAFLSPATGRIALSQCIQAGDAGVGQPCQPRQLRGQPSLDCATGLHCFPFSTSQGVCLPACNAAIGVPDASIGCQADQVCVDLYRQQTASPVIGVCASVCDAFDAGSCAAGFSCVPTPPDGTAYLGTGQAGVCVPLRPGAAPANERCVDIDPLRGASCQPGTVCGPRADPSSPTWCEAPCDLGCLDAGVPCATGGCPSGRSCQSIRTQADAILGLCR